ncbi:MAG: hypothetical protein J6D44_03270 [Pseudomonas sp.]|nr:hypothetical protein [Pseudomonas sp.]
MSDLNRKQFEEWFDESGFYKFKETAWAAWEASRECLVIELPEKARITDPSDMLFIGSNGAINKCRDAIHAAGVKTK